MGRRQLPWAAAASGVAVLPHMVQASCPMGQVVVARPTRAGHAAAWVAVACPAPNRQQVQAHGLVACPRGAGAALQHCCAAASLPLAAASPVACQMEHETGCRRRAAAQKAQARLSGPLLQLGLQVCCLGGPKALQPPLPSPQQTLHLPQQTPAVAAGGEAGGSPLLAPHHPGQCLVLRYRFVPGLRHPACAVRAAA